MKSVLFTTLALLLFAVACQKPQPAAPAAEPEAPADNTLTAAEADSGWILLFDGKTSNGWRGYLKPGFPEGWVIEDGSLKSLGTAADASGGDIVYAADSFGEFELTVDWKISKGGNSGIFYHIVEDAKYPAPYFTAPEYQVIDDANFPDPLEDWQQVGADYAMYPAELPKMVKPAGEWNSSRIIFTNEKAEYWLNGKRTVSFVPYSEDWNTRRNSGKWDDFPDYAKSKTGLIGFQDHGSFIWYKNIKIRKL